MLKTINNGKMPTRGSKYSACIDLYANEDVAINAGESKLIGLGVCIDQELLNKVMSREFENLVGIDNIGHPSVERDAFNDMWKSSHYLQLMPRSSLGKKLIIPHGVGIVDIDYRNEIMIRLHNPINSVENTDYIIKKGERIAQITLLEHKSYLFGIGTEEVREGGFGSTNKKGVK